jgi:hypothetical protein
VYWVHKQRLHSRCHQREQRKASKTSRRDAKTNNEASHRLRSVLLSENNELRQEQEAANQSVSTLTSTVKDLTEENKELRKELDWYKKQEFGV